MAMRTGFIHSCAELVEHINEVGFLPLLEGRVPGWSAEEAVDEECRYTPLPEGGWQWSLWEWKGEAVRESGCAYGKFIDHKATFISREWWPDFCNYRRSLLPKPEAGSIEECILYTLAASGSLTTRDLRAACGFTGTKLRGRFDAYVARLQMATYIVTEDFVYPHDRHGRPYGWGWSLLTTPEALFGASACHAPRTPEESRLRILTHLWQLLPDTSERLIATLLK